MSIRLREVDGILVALCAAKSIPKDGDIYLDDAAHEALATKFALDHNEEWDLDLPYEPRHKWRINVEESNNPNREWWDRTYAE